MSRGSKLLDQLQAEPDRFDFYELVRLLEHALGADVGEIDRTALPGRVAFGHSPDLGFPASDVASLKVEQGAARVVTTFLGLLGTASPLTPEWTEQVLHDDDEGALGAFYDVFHHRAVSMLFAAWKVHALEGGFDLGGDDALSKRLRSLAGVDGWADAGDEPLSPMAAVGLTDHQRGQPQTIDLPSAEALLRRLHPDWDVRLKAGVERFVPFSSSERATLGVARCRLGEDLVYGDGCTEAESSVRLLVGPVDGQTYESLMPGGRHYAGLERLTRQIFAGAVDIELEVEVRPADAPTCVLGRRAGGRLGIDTRYSADRQAPVRARVALLQDASAARREFV
jgi:type VI secretion system protein ImpH